MNDVKGVKKTSEKKKKRRNHSQLGPDFVAPDGGFGWFICFAAGFSNFCTFPVLQQFGLIFRDHLAILEIPAAEITTMINMNQALTCLIGLANGPVFRRFTFRQVSSFGATLVATALLFTSFADSFINFLITFSIFYGAGCGLTTSANSLALNTYFKEKRRIVTGISWSCTALGPIIFPHIVTALMPRFGVQGTVLIFSAIAMNAVCCAMLLQPVRWHTEKKPRKSSEEALVDQVTEIKCLYCQSMKKKSHSLMSSQYLHNVDDYLAPGYEIIDPGTPMLAAANDGWFSSTPAKRSLYGSKISLSSKKGGGGSRKQSIPSNFINTSNTEGKPKRTKEILSNEKIEENPTEDCPSHKSPNDMKNSQNLLSIKVNLPPQQYKTSPTTPSFVMKQISEGKYLKDNKSNRSMQGNSRQSFRMRSNTFNIEKEILNVAKSKLEQYMNDANEHMIKCHCEEIRKAFIEERQVQTKEVEEVKFTFWQKFVIFFDLDLLKDFTYINIMIGITIANFAELNFSVLTPFVLADFGFTKSQISMCMSLLGAADISCRFFIPFIAGFIGWENRTFFLVGVLGMAMGRIVLAHFQSYYIALLVFLWIGFNKGLRTVFMVLCIPSHVPLDRLPSATGIHLLFSGIFYIVIGPVIGLIRDHSDYTITLHCLNISTYICALSWTLERLIRNHNEKRNKIEQEQINVN